jgi:hypothetical protein
VAGHVLDISKHENAAKKAPAQPPGKRARLYSFPVPPPVLQPQPQVAAPAEHAPKSRFRLHLAVELGIGCFIWLLWYVWRLLH